VRKSDVLRDIYDGKTRDLLNNNSLGPSKQKRTLMISTSTVVLDCGKGDSPFIIGDPIFGPL